ncbi:MULTISPECIES: molybdenum cofactor guanylyltransferase MobA [Glaesserella]|uniref:Molybdenum cofactor guanylyltransferase n=1 Tax=Glaesserella australis TaxID=2094024 RepID=A0A328BXG6_9PAST|nr:MULTISPECIES: molybdenum cofactor guanylyltransferase MobA [Glaesserella]AUI66972.1 bifunctional molybdenum cofactor guanylyltransferase MobA/molybdopterin-guanine dinucleotide biosynthesis adaptor protein MobB [Glaesserella sp. 15-184]RAL18936.1 bifunctional molybdenum cofactor guanylyltransferase MobA/molybdopterin-guanine dinucleotide biosynthesis adaptor protein MobB [Glaesserella australis]
MQFDEIQGVILAGGLARRLNGVQKGLQPLWNKPLISHILERLSPQICKIWLNVNRLHDVYQQQYPDLPQYSDRLEGFQGALSGILSGFEQIESDYLLFVPCDTPFLPDNLVAKLHTALRINDAQIAYAHDGERPHPTVALIHRSVVPALQDYLHSGERRLFHFFQSQKSVAVDFSEQKQAFKNFNTPADFALPPLAGGDVRRTEWGIPLLAITGYSGTGKTTLLEKLIPALNQRQIKVGLIKHSHHNVDVDKQGKDSHRLRLAGANPTMVVCDQRWAMMVETSSLAAFERLVKQMETEQVDLILVEGFKHEQLPKIQLHRQGIEKPLPELDEFTIATATDYPLARENRLDINDVEQIAEFVVGYLKK